MIAVRYGHKKVVGYLLRLGIFDLSTTKNKRGETVEDLGIEKFGFGKKGGWPSLKLLSTSIPINIVNCEPEFKEFKEETDIDFLFFFVEMGWREKVMEVLESLRKRKKNPEEFLSKGKLTDSKGNNLLMVSLLLNHRELIGYLMSLPIFDKKAKNKKGQTIDDFTLRDVPRRFSNEAVFQLKLHKLKEEKKEEKEMAKEVIFIPSNYINRRWILSFREKFERHRKDENWKKQCENWKDEKGGNNLLMVAVILKVEEMVRCFLQLNLYPFYARNLEGKNVNDLGNEKFGKEKWSLIIEEACGI